MSAVKSFVSNITSLFKKEKETKQDTELKDLNIKIINKALENPDNPYLLGYATYTGINSDINSKIKMMNNVNRALLVVILLLVLMLIGLASTSKVQPYVVAINQNGQVFDMNESVVNVDDDKLRPKLATAYLNEYVRGLFSVVADGQVLRDNQAKVYAMTEGRAFNLVEEFYKKQNPEMIAEKRTVGIEINYTLPLSGNTMRISWKEVTRDVKSASIISRKSYVGEFTYDWNIHSTQELVQTFNPLGFYITSFEYSLDGAGNEK